MEKEKITKKTILIVDDEHDIRNVFKQILVTEGYGVTTAPDGKQGFKIFQKTPNFDLVIMDMIMPEWNGNKTLQEMKRIVPDVKVLFITGFDKTETLPELLKMGAVGCLKKPFGLETLIDKVRTVLK